MTSNNKYSITEKHQMKEKNQIRSVIVNLTGKQRDRHRGSREEGMDTLVGGCSRSGSSNLLLPPNYLQNKRIISVRYEVSVHGKAHGKMNLMKEKVKQSELNFSNECKHPNMTI
jgi:hypothetical protein